MFQEEIPMDPTGSRVQVTTCAPITSYLAELPSSPDFVPLVRSVESDLPGCPVRGEDSYRRFERARNRARLQEQHSKAVEKNRQEVELEQIRQKGIQRAITHDHTYANSEGEPVSLEEPLSEGSVVREEYSDLNDERLNEDEELNRELLMILVFQLKLVRHSLVKKSMLNLCTVACLLLQNVKQR